MCAMHKRRHKGHRYLCSELQISYIVKMKARNKKFLIKPLEIQGEMYKTTTLV